MASSYFNNSDSEHDSPSPYPPSTPSIDSEDDQRPIAFASCGLRASIASLREYQLRDVIMRLADSSPQFRRALRKEIAFLEELDTPPTTPTETQRRPKSKRNNRARKSQSCGGRKQSSGICGEAKPETHVPQDDNSSRSDCVYHPGQLEDEVYEFVSRTPNGAAFKVAQTVTMWSCCNEDEWSPGCILIAPAAFGRVVDRSTHQLALNTRSLAHDVYPDSDLESPCSDFMTPTALRRGRLMV